MVASSCSGLPGVTDKLSSAKRRCRSGRAEVRFGEVTASAGIEKEQLARHVRCPADPARSEVQVTGYALAMSISSRTVFAGNDG